MPVTESAYYILVSLVQPRHGYRIMKYVEEVTGGQSKLGPATLYTVLGKLIDEGLIERLETAEALDDRRKTYRLTGQGQRVLIDEVIRRHQMAKIGVEALKARGIDLSGELENGQAK